jgi:hypothetical protein
MATQLFGVPVWVKNKGRHTYIALYACVALSSSNSKFKNLSTQSNLDNQSISTLSVGLASDLWSDLWSVFAEHHPQSFDFSAEFCTELPKVLDS